MSIIIKGGDSQNLASVNEQGELLTYARLETTGTSSLPVRSAVLPSVSKTFLPGETGIVGPIDTTLAGSCSFQITNAEPGLPFAGNPVVTFEQSQDGQSWAALPAMRSDTNVIRATRVLEPNLAYRAMVFDAETVGSSLIRARVATGCQTHAMKIVIYLGGLPFTPFMATVRPVRRSLLISNTAMPVGASGAETMLTLNRVLEGRSFDTGTSFVVPAGRTYLMENLTVSQVGAASGGNNTTAAVSVFKMRFAPQVPVTVDSPVAFQARLATVNQAGDYNSLSFPLAEGIVVEGDGKACFGVSVNTTYAAAPTVDVAMIGCEY